MDILRHHSIIFIVPSMKLNSYRFGEFLKEFFTDVNLSKDLPTTNKNETIIIVPTNSKTFEELLYSNFSKRSYEKFPKSIIVIIGFDVLLNISFPFEYISLLNQYNVPLIYSSINENNISIKIKMVNINSYENSLIYNSNNETVHITNYSDFNNIITDMITGNSESNYDIYCYYDDNNKNQWNEVIKKYEDVVKFYKKIIFSSGKKLDLEKGKLVLV